MAGGGGVPWADEGGYGPSLNPVMFEEADPEGIAQTPEPFRRIRPLGLEEVKTIVAHEIDDALGGLGSRIAEERRQAIRYFYGRPFGNEQEGRSSVVLTDVADTIEWIMPSIMSMLTDSGTLWEYQAANGSPEASDYAKQATEAINHIFFEQCDGYMVIHDWVKTALLEKNGFVHPRFEERFEPRHATYRGVTEAELGVIMNDDTVEITEFAEHVGDRDLLDINTGLPRTTFDITTLQVKTVGEFVVDGIPPEEFLMARRAIKLNDRTPFTGHRRKIMVSDLIALGYDPDLITTIPSDDTPEYSQGRTERLSEDETFPISTADRADPASREIWVSDCYLRIDEDGDGFSELKRIIAAGAGPVTILSDYEVTSIPFCSLTSVPMPHKFFGRSIADQVMDLQLIRSTLLRQMLDNIYLTNNVRHQVVEGMVNIDDLLTSRPGGIVRVTAMGNMEEIVTKPLPGHAMEMMSFLDSVRETRTGVSKWQQGPEPASLKNVARGAVSDVQQMAGMKVGLIAQIFAETGIKRLGQQMYRIFVENATRPRTMRLRGEWIDVDPTLWARDMDCIVQVGLGLGESSRRQSNLEVIAANQKEMLQNGLSMMVTPKNIYNTAMAYQEAMGMRHDNRFFTDPGNQPFPKPEPAMSDQVDMLEAKVRELEHQRRLVEDRQTAERDAARLMVDADTQDKLHSFRYDELQQKHDLGLRELATREEVARIQIEGNLRRALAASTPGGTA